MRFKCLRTKVAVLFTIHYRAYLKFVCVYAEVVNNQSAGRTVIIRSEEKGASFLNECLFVFLDGFQQKAMNALSRGGN